MSKNMDKVKKMKYDMEYRKKHKVQFNVDLNREDNAVLAKILETLEITKAEFLRNAIKEAAEKNGIKF